MAISIKTYKLKSELCTFHPSNVTRLQLVLKSKHIYIGKCVTHGVGVRFRSLCRCLSRSRLWLRERSLDFSIFFFPRSFSLSLDRLRDRRDLSRRSLSFSLSLLRLRRCDFFSRPILITKHGQSVSHKRIMSDTKYSHLHVKTKFILVKYINNLTTTTSLLNTSHNF